MNLIVSISGNYIYSVTREGKVKSKYCANGDVLELPENLTWYGKQLIELNLVSEQFTEEKQKELSNFFNVKEPTTEQAIEVTNLLEQKRKAKGKVKK